MKTKDLYAFFIFRQSEIFFSKLKEHLGETHFSNEDVIYVVNEWLARQESILFSNGIEALRH